MKTAFHAALPWIVALAAIPMSALAENEPVAEARFDINFLTGKGVASQGLDDGQPIEGKFTPVALADWSYDSRPKPCEF